jgi:hypothetical protein
MPVSTRDHERPRNARIVSLCRIPDILPSASKKLQGYERAWSVRISDDYRAVGERQGNTIYWIWIGTHNEFDNLFG